MNVDLTHAESQPVDASAQREAIRFAYASGSKPLSGYTVKRGIGRGGFGEVYYAVSDGGKEVALKLIRRNFDVELRGVAHCLNLKHPNLLGLHDVRTDDRDDRWVVMEYVTGQSLEEVIAAHPVGMPEEEVNAWIRGIAAGVGYLHECGIVHRDVKPGNIFSDRGLVKIGDYGLSKFISCSRRSGQTESVGTVHYMAPEIANGRYGKEIDIYAVGVMLYEMLTGRVPFEGESVGEILMKHLTAEPDVSVLLDPYRTIVGRALAKDPAVRYQSLDELVADLPATGDGPSRAFEQPRVRSGDLPVDAELAEPVTATLVGHAGHIEEPLWRWLKSTFVRIGHIWNNDLNTPTQVVLILVSLWVFFATAPYLIPAAIFACFFYLVYRGIWSLANWYGSPSSDEGPGEQAPQPYLRAHEVQQAVATDVVLAQQDLRPEAPSHGHRRQRRHRRWHQQPTVPAKSVRQRATELTGSMVLGALVCLVISVVMLVLRGESATPEQFAWLALAGIAGTWGVLIPAKVWEGREGEPALRRFSMLVIGLAIGALACGLQQFLWVGLPHEFSAEPLFAQNGGAYRIQLSDSQAFAPHSLMTHISYFGFLFLLIRWWRLADPQRNARLSLWSTAVCVTWAGALYMLWPFPASWAVFPQPWGFMLAGTIAIAVQLASPWMNARQRKALETA